MTLYTFPDGTIVHAYDREVTTTLGPCDVCGISDGTVHEYCTLASELQDAAVAAVAAAPKLWAQEQTRWGKIEEFLVLWNWMTVDVTIARSKSGAVTALCNDKYLTLEERLAVQVFVLEQVS